MSDAAAPVETPVAAEPVKTEVATDVDDVKSARLGIKEAFRRYQATKAGRAAAAVASEETPGDGAEAQAEPAAEKPAAVEKPKADPREELKARLREGRKIAAEKLAVQREKAEIEAAKADLAWAREVKAAKAAGDMVKLSKLTGIEVQELLTQYAQHDRELTAEERLEKLENERKAEKARAEKDSEERAQQERQGNLRNAVSAVEQLARANPQEFRFIHAKGLAANVVEYALLSHQEGKPLTAEQAAREFEANYRELRRRELTEDQSLLSDSPGTSAPRNQPAAAPTITNRAAAGAPATTAREQREQALAMLRNVVF